MGKTNRFHVKDIDEDKIVVEEERKQHSPFILFFIRNGKLIFVLSLLFSITTFIIAIGLALHNAGNSSIVMYESNGVNVKFNGSDGSILNGTPITKEYASSLFNSSINDSNGVGVVIKVKEVELEDRTIVYYSDKTVLVKYKDGSYLWVSSIDGDYGVDEEGRVDRRATSKNLTGTTSKNESLDITITYFSDGTLEVTKGDDTFFVRNSDVTNNDDVFYSNLSGVSLPVSEENGEVHYSDGTIKKDDYIIVDGNKYGVKEVKKIHDDITIIYYENGYAEVVKDGLSVMVRKSGHIVYDDYILEIVDNEIKNVDIKDVMDVKEITLDNTNAEAVHYIVVLEETDDYAKHNVNRILLNDFINFNVYVNGTFDMNKILNNNLRGREDLAGLDSGNNTYLLHEGSIDGLSSVTIKLGLWISYEDITNQYMDSAFIGTVKVYIEEIK